jgi:hypothetical protein
MTITRRNVMWPLLVIATGSIWLLMVAGAVPKAIGDILLRCWPALLILFAFDVLFGRRRLRVRRLNIEMSLIGLLVMAAALAGIIYFAYQKQADVLRIDYQRPFSQVLTPEITRVRLDLTLDRTTITIRPAQADPRELAANFVGSRESDVNVNLAVEGDTATLSVIESHPNAIPKLDDYGRGALEVVLPADVVIEVFTLRSSRGDISADLRPLRIEQFDLAVKQGDLTINLPGLDVSQGILKTDQGSVTVSVPQELALILKAHGSPRYQYDSLRYDLLEGGTLKRENVQAFQISLDVFVAGGAALTVVDVP